MITSVDKVLFLKGVDLFSELSGRDLLSLAMIAEEVHFESGEEIFAEGAEGDSLFVVVDGEVEVIKGGRSIAVLSVRETFGEMALLDSEPRSATVAAVEAVTALRIDREPFFDLLATRREIAFGVIRILTRRLRKTSSQR